MIAKNGGEVLRRKRKKLRLTQRELGFISGCSHAFIGQLERGESTVTPELAAQIVFRLGCDLEDVFEERRTPAMEQMPTRNAGTSHPVAVA